ncbi:MAG: DEAD/DEAH box helicase [Bdellovibrionaceae bacterium]|nr:DEAD/DEAH box helicase [Pseudobdellovibrionaceae bacterium]
MAMQIHQFVKELAGKNFNLSPALVIGGMSMRQQNTSSEAARVF